MPATTGQSLSFPQLEDNSRIFLVAWGATSGASLEHFHLLDRHHSSLIYITTFAGWSALDSASREQQHRREAAMAFRHSLLSRGSDTVRAGNNGRVAKPSWTFFQYRSAMRLDIFAGCLSERSHCCSEVGSRTASFGEGCGAWRRRGCASLVPPPASRSLFPPPLLHSSLLSPHPHQPSPRRAARYRPSIKRFDLRHRWEKHSAELGHRREMAARGSRSRKVCTAVKPVSSFTGATRQPRTEPSADRAPPAPATAPGQHRPDDTTNDETYFLLYND
jgi:hypothetical protein